MHDVLLRCDVHVVFFFKQKTAYEMRISDWSSDVCSSDLRAVGYSFDAEKIMQDKGVVVRADYVEHLPPDVSAAQYWLNNRKGYDWKSKVEHEHSGKIGLEQLVAGQGQEPDPETP